MSEEIDGLIGQNGSDAPDAYAAQAMVTHSAELAPAERCPRASDVPGQGRSETAADAEPDEEDGQDHREGISGGAEQQRQHARPHHLRAQRGHARQCNRDIHQPCAGGCHDGAAGHVAVLGHHRVRRTGGNQQCQQGDDDVEHHRHQRRGRHVDRRAAGRSRRACCRARRRPGCRRRRNRARRHHAASSQPSVQWRARSRPSGTSAAAGRCWPPRPAASGWPDLQPAIIV